MAAETGNPIPAAALLRVGAIEEAITAGYKALEKNPKSPVLECMAATIGPDIEEILQALLKHLSKDNLPEGLRQLQKCYPGLR
jgi:hypothetical protein